MPKLKQFRIVSTQMVSYEYFVEAETEEEANEIFNERCESEDIWEHLEIVDEHGLEYEYTDEMDEAFSNEGCTVEECMAHLRKAGEEHKAWLKSEEYKKIMGK